MLIAPSILSADFGRLAEEVAAVSAAGADWIHVDVMDGHFVPNLTIGPAVVAAVRRATTLPLDVHLMVTDPDSLLVPFWDAGADILTVHVEACVHLQRTLTRIRELGARAGVALNPHTPIGCLDYLLDDLDLVLVMTVNPGFGGQPFLPAMLPKVSRISAAIAAWRAGRSEQKPIDIEVDGGMNAGTVAQAAKVGVTVFVAGSAIFSQPDYGEIIRSLRNSALAGSRSGA